MSENHDAGSVSEQQPWVAGDEEKTQFVDRSALQQPTAATPDAGEHTQVVPPAVVAPQQFAQVLPLELGILTDVGRDHLLDLTGLQQHRHRRR